MQALERLSALLEAVAAREHGRTLSELVTTTELPTATCHRLLQDLTAAGLVEREPRTKRYRPGSRLVRLAVSVTAFAHDGELHDAVLRRLRDTWQECFYLTAYVDGQNLCIRNAPVTDLHRAGISVPVGRALSMHSSASSRAILAALDDDVALDILRHTERVRFTPTTKTSLRDLRAELRATRTRGYAVCDQETELGMYAVAVPVRTGSSVSGSIGVIGVREQIRPSIEAGMIDDLVDAAAAMGDRALPGPVRGAREVVSGA